MVNYLEFSFVVPYAYIYPYMTYCIEVWGCASQTQLNCLFLLQKKNHKNNELLSLFSTYQSTFPLNGSSSFKENIFFRKLN